jgi:hypothetical protein
MKRFAGIFAFTSTIAAVLPAIADAAVLGGSECGGLGGLPLVARLVPFC